MRKKENNPGRKSNFPIYVVIGVYIIFIVISIAIENAEIVNHRTFIYTFVSGLVGNFIIGSLSIYFISANLGGFGNLFRFEGRKREYVFFFVSFFLALILAYLTAHMNSFFSEYLPTFDIELYHQDLSRQFQKIENRILAFLGTGLITGFSEEVFFRGLCFNIIRKKRNIVVAILSNIIIFILLHPVPAFIPGYIIVNVVICLLYYYSRTLWTPVIMHVTLNLTSLMFI